jgi:hypothetical protein
MSRFRRLVGRFATVDDAARAALFFEEIRSPKCLLSLLFVLLPSLGVPASREDAPGVL